MREEIKQIAERLVGLRDALDLTPEEIAAACGFHSATYFATVFKGIMGMTPSAFRHSLHG